MLQDIVRCHRARHRVRHPRRPPTGCSRRARPAYQLTWMDANVDDWVVTPRRGKAVEINALWHNALVLLDGWLDAPGVADEGDELAREAARCRGAFNARFWNPADAAPVRRRRWRARRRRRAAARTRSWRSPCRTRRSIGSTGRPCSTSVTRELADAGRPAHAVAARTPTTSASTSATCARATPPITRARCGRG